MAKAVLFFLLILFLLSCKKAETDAAYADLFITKAEAPANTTVSEGITVKVQCYGPDLCYTFSHFDIVAPELFQYDIIAKASLPGKPAVCPQAIYKVDTSLTIQTAVKGRYVLRFHSLLSSSMPLITDTVQVH
jgi:hypothetical protein